MLDKNNLTNIIIINGRVKDLNDYYYPNVTVKVNLNKQIQEIIGKIIHDYLQVEPKDNYLDVKVAVVSKTIKSIVNLITKNENL